MVYSLFTTTYTVYSLLITTYTYILYLQQRLRYILFHTRYTVYFFLKITYTIILVHFITCHMMGLLQGNLMKMLYL